MILTTKAEALICPTCGRRAMTESQKLWLGPLFTKPCQSCGTRLSISWGDSLYMSWPISIACLGFMGAVKMGLFISRLFEFSLAISVTIYFVFGLAVPIGLFLTLLMWASIRSLDLGPRIGLVVRGAPRTDPKPPVAH